MPDRAEDLICSSDLVVFATVAGQPHVSDLSWFLAVGKYVYDEVARSAKLHIIDEFFDELRRYGWAPEVPGQQRRRAAGPVTRGAGGAVWDCRAVASYLYDR